MIASSPRFDDLLALSATWRQLPSTLALRYMPELRRMGVTPADWFAFDVAATARWADLRREHEEQQPRQGSASHQRAMPPRLRPGAVQDNGGDFAIRGNEIPPWDARYQATKRADQSR